MNDDGKAFVYTGTYIRNLIISTEIVYEFKLTNKAILIRFLMRIKKIYSLLSIIETLNNKFAEIPPRV